MVFQIKKTKMKPKHKLHIEYPDIKYIHLRYNDIPNEDANNICTYGGTTLAYQFNKTDNGVELDFGIAICSDGDNYNRSIGRRIALHRLLSKAPKYHETVKLSPEEAVSFTYEDIIHAAYTFWPDELEAWNMIINDDDDETEFENYKHGETKLDSKTITQQPSLAKNNVQNVLNTVKIQGKIT
jgi:hypothetical protein